MTSIAQTLKDCEAQLCAAGAPYEMEEVVVGGQSYRQFKQAPSTFRELLDGGRQHGDAEFLVYAEPGQTEERRSFNAFYRRVDALAYQLIEHYKLQQGQRVAIAMRNYPEWMEAYTAVASLGAIVVPLNSWGTAEELEFVLRDSAADIVFCDQRRLELLSPLLADLPCRAIVARGEATAQAESMEALITGAEGRAMPQPWQCQPDDPVQIMYSSGTSGKPKGALSTHRNITQAIISFEAQAIMSAMANPKAIEAMFAGGNAPCSLLSVPLFHVSGCYAAFLLNLRGGRKIVMTYKWDAGDALRLIEQEKVTIFSAAPSMVIDLLQHPDYENYDTSSLFSLGGGGSACPPTFKRVIDERFEQAYVGTGYGMTESNAIGASCSGLAYEYQPGSAGTLSPLVDFKTCDEHGNDLARGQQGEIWLRSVCNIRSYWQRPEANASQFNNGWMATGDIGYLDEEGFVHLADRAKDLIIRGGENIYPAEIEGVLSKHPAVLESAVFGLPDERMGEAVAAVIRLNDGQSVSADELKDFLGKQLAAFKHPQHIAFSTAPLQRNATGKLLKKQIKADYAKLAQA
ncbi:class I adenylate-forming enzyme family protein [Spongiibacter sp.]|uniref:class I adenylate-forming enzyme family protein n=1 Tax=Spongiibacter sp. TaxID=2024860 RepID=UPI003563DD76